MLIAVQIFFGTELALSVTFGDTSPKGRGFCSRAGRSLKIKRVLPKYTAM